MLVSSSSCSSARAGVLVLECSSVGECSSDLVLVLECSIARARVLVLVSCSMYFVAPNSSGTAS